MKEFFRRYAFNVPVHGKNHSAIYNLQKGKIYTIPNSLFEIIQETETKSLQEIKNHYQGDDQSTLNEYIEFLIHQKIGFLTKEPERFPNLSLEWRSPEIINNAIIEHAENYDIKSVLTQLDHLGCKHIELRILSDLSTKKWSSLLKETEGKIFRSISILVAYYSLLTRDVVDNLYQKFKKIQSIVIYRSPHSLTDISSSSIKFINKDLSEIFLQEYPKDKYIVNIPFFTEAQQHNPYYNRKVCIDKNGDIKNSLLLARSFGKIQETTLQDIINQASFQELWYASADKINEMKDSPFRYCQMVTSELVKLPDGNYTII